MFVFWLFDEWLEPGYEFDEEFLLAYNHMSFGGPPVTVETVEEADELTRNSEKESAIGKWVVTTPKLHVLSFTDTCLLLRDYLSS